MLLGGYITKKDFYDYKSIIRDPIYTTSVDGLKMCGPPPPSSSAIVQAILNVMACMFYTLNLSLPILSA